MRNKSDSNPTTTNKLFGWDGMEWIGQSITSSLSKRRRG